jgi:hypothetical protein
METAFCLANPILEAPFYTIQITQGFRVKPFGIVANLSESPKNWQLSTEMGGNFGLKWVATFN